MKPSKFIPMGEYPLNKWKSIYIMLNENKTQVLYSIGGKIAQRWQALKRNTKGTYFFINGDRYFLHDFYVCS